MAKSPCENSHMNLSQNIKTYVYIYLEILERICISTHVSMCLFMHASIYVCMYVCMYIVCIHYLCGAISSMTTSPGSGNLEANDNELMRGKALPEGGCGTLLATSAAEAGVGGGGESPAMPKSRCSMSIGDLCSCRGVCCGFAGTIELSCPCCTSSCMHGGSGGYWCFEVNRRPGLGGLAD